MAEKKFQILSLDGGGIKGVYTAAVLTSIENDLGVNVTEHFDLIAGTSTGGIIAIGLGLGFRPRELLDMYLNNGSKIFSINLFGGVSKYFQNQYDNNNLKEVLLDFFGEKKFGESNTRLVVPSYSMTNNDVYLFRTSHSDHLKRDWKLEAYKVALATSAAPSYFQCFKGIDNNRLIDGGVWANNPVMVAITEAIGFLNFPLENIRALSLGTTNPTKQRPSSLDEGGLLNWSTHAADLIMEGQSIGATNQASNLLGKDNFFRLNSTVADGQFALDKINDLDELIGKASHDSRKYLNKLEAFFKEKAGKYEPIYK